MMGKVGLARIVLVAGVSLTALLCGDGGEEKWAPESVVTAEYKSPNQDSKYKNEGMGYYYWDGNCGVEIAD